MFELSAVRRAAFFIKTESGIKKNPQMFLVGYPKDPQMFPICVGYESYVAIIKKMKRKDAA